METLVILKRELQKNPYIRLAYYQCYNYFGWGDKDDEDDKSEEEYEETLNLLLKKASEIVSNKCKLIVLLDRGIEIDDSGNVKENKKDFHYIYLKQACENNNIIFVDMYDEFKKKYNEEKILPNGFMNTKVGSGHLNRNGHELIAKKLYSIVNESEEVK